MVNAHVAEFSKEMARAQPRQPNCASWKEWVRTSSRPTNAGHPQLGTLTNSDHNGCILWSGLRETLRLGDDFLTGTTIVANVLDGSVRDYKTKAHWHAPPVINVHLFGSASKKYRFVAWQHMPDDARVGLTDLHDADLDALNTFSATIGPLSQGNCVIFPACMLHEIKTTRPSTRLSVPTTGAQLARALDRLPLGTTSGELELIEKMALTTSSGATEEARAAEWASLLTQPHLAPSSAMNRAANIFLGRSIESDDKTLYLGFGTYIVLRHGRMVQESLRLFDASLVFDSWLKQLSPNHSEAMSIANVMRLSMSAAMPSGGPSGHPVAADADAIRQIVFLLLLHKTGDLSSLDLRQINAQIERELRLTVDKDYTASWIKRLVMSMSEEMTYCASCGTDILETVQVARCHACLRSICSDCCTRLASNWKCAAHRTGGTAPT